MAEFRIDALGETCPTPLLKVQEKWIELQVGDILIIHIDSYCALKKIPDWARKEGYNVEVEEIKERVWDIYIEKSA
ncbi:sulfurtransferase TusA family protein [Pelosinus sp. sgz500959]|uniref:sulfurtransferase TusA family protein n=1 Tax=Pelosinus sp. sgz500959 TaxID=3242472 RepID=UPI00366AB229